jgi:hypothetical protein
LATKVDKVSGKELSANDYTTAEKNKLAAITGTNTGDQDLSGYATTAQLASKANTSDVTTSLATKEDISNKSNAALGTSTILFPTQNAVKTYVDAQISNATIADADATTRGKIQLAGDLAGTATSPSVVKLRGTPISSVAPSTAGHVLTYDVNGNAIWAAPTNSANTISGVVPVANGGTGLSSVPANGQILIGNGSGFTLATLTAGTGITITNTSGTITIAASAVAVRPTTDQFSASANQLSFTLTQTPLTNANSLHNVWMFINGVRTNNLAYTVSGTTVTYDPAQNGAYALLAGDRIQFDYAY